MRISLKAFMAGVLAMASAAAFAFPTRPVTLVVPYAPGGSTDVLARVLAEVLAQDLGQPVVVENAAGAGGTIGTSKVVRSPKDGHTVLLHNMAVATAPALYSNLTFDPARDLEPVAMAGDVPMILVRNKDFPPSTVQELIQAMKDKPGQVNFSHAGIGATSHLCAMLFTQSTGTTATMVPYRGTGPALQDLIAGNVDLICDQPVATGPHIKAGALRPYAVATRERLDILPEVPTFAQAGLQGFELAVWHGLYVPQGTPAEAVERLNRAVRAAFGNAALVQRLGEMGVVVPQGERLSAQFLRQHTQAEIARWKPIIEQAGVKAE
ncbi:tripartite tricarboxylate transporter substrate-binding protein [Orrella sp. JC864]|uniref:tripartite tricarboxylate transporter substrate-binding protein n=1 Tax=Orrella sp. JC864 TaxID=3120298 RepID=UPI00300B6A14